MCLANFRGGGEKFVCMRHRGSGYFSRKMCVAARFIVECIEDCKRGQVSRTRAGASLCGNEALRASQKCGEFFFLSGLCLQF